MIILVSTFNPYDLTIEMSQLIYPANLQILDTSTSCKVGPLLGTGCLEEMVEVEMFSSSWIAIQEGNVTSRK